MAIITENFEINGRSFVRTYSDAGRYIVRDGIIYTEANDPEECGRIYMEGDIITDEAGPEDYEWALQQMGVNFNDEN